MSDPLPEADTMTDQVCRIRTPETLKLTETMSGLRYTLEGRPLLGGDTVALCFSGGWVVGRYEWNSDPAERPKFHCSIELAGGEVERFEIDIPERALLLRQSPGAIL